MRVTVKLFGAFRVLGEILELDVPSNANISQIRAAMMEPAATAELLPTLEVSRFANEREVLAETAPCEPGDVLAILPPVSGG